MPQGDTVIANETVTTMARTGTYKTAKSYVFAIIADVECVEHKRVVT